MPDGAPAGRRPSTPDTDAAVERLGVGGQRGGRRLVLGRAVLEEDDAVGDLHKSTETVDGVGENEERESQPCRIGRLGGVTSNLRV